MQYDALLPTIAEIGATIAGFSGVVALFRRGATPGESDVDVYLVRDVVRISLLVTGFALLPFVPAGLGMTEPAVWRASSALLAITIAASMATSLFEIRRVHEIDPIKQNPLPPWLLLPTVGLMQGLLWATALGLASSSAPTFFLAALLLLLMLAGLFFIRLLVPTRTE